MDPRFKIAHREALDWGVGLRLCTLFGGLVLRMGLVHDQ